VSEPQAVQLPCIGGINRLVDARRIKDTECYATVNCTVGEGDLVKTRNGTTLIQRIKAWDNRAGFPAFGGSNGAIPTWQIWAPRLDSQSNYLVYARTGTSATDDPVVLRVDSNGEVQDWCKFEGGVGFNIPPTRPQAFTMGSTMYIVNGLAAVDSSSNFGQLMAVDYSGATPAMSAVDWEDDQNVDAASFSPWPYVATVYRNRAVYADFSGTDTGGSLAGKEYANYVIFSDPNLPLTIGEDAVLVRAMQVGSVDDGRIVAMTEVMQTAAGSPTQSALLVLCEFAAYVITGEPNLSTDTDQDPESIFGSLVVSKFNVSCGCASAETVCRTPRGLIWAGHDQVWLMEEGSVPRPVGKKIRPLLKENSAAKRPSWCATYFEGYYRLSITGVDDPDPAAGASFVTTNVQWWLDLNSQVGGEDDARWFGPMQYYSGPNGGLASMVVENRVGGAPRLLGLQRDVATDYDLLLDMHPSTPAVTDRISSSGTTATDIEFGLVTKRFTLGDAAADKIFHGSEFVSKSSDDGTMYVDVDVPGTSATGSVQIYGTGDFDGYGSALDESTPDYPRIAGKDMQFTMFLSNGGGLELSQWVVWVEVVPRRPTM
jgi:hypothetical protein